MSLTTSEALDLAAVLLGAAFGAELRAAVHGDRGMFAGESPLALLAGQEEREAQRHGPPWPQGFQYSANRLAGDGALRDFLAAA